MGVTKRYYGFAAESLPGLLRAASDIFNHELRVKFVLVSGGFAIFSVAVNTAMQLASFPGEADISGRTILSILKILYFIYSVHSLLYVLRLNNSAYLREKIETLPWVLCRFPGRFLILNIDEIERLRQKHTRREVLRLNRESRRRIKLRFHGDQSQFSRDVLKWLDRNRSWNGIPIFEDAINQMLLERSSRGDVDKLLSMGFSFFGSYKGVKRANSLTGNA